ncbi:MAG: hypothetical protein FJ087_17835 [Deltaproteobacteria bacterium]|nr:hypothetical protein [Deltaproteobacteria bacterium]
MRRVRVAATALLLGALCACAGPAPRVVGADPGEPGAADGESEGGTDDDAPDADERGTSEADAGGPDGDQTGPEAADEAPETPEDAGADAIAETEGADADPAEEIPPPETAPDAAPEPTPDAPGDLAADGAGDLAADGAGDLAADGAGDLAADGAGDLAADTPPDGTGEAPDPGCPVCAAYGKPSVAGTLAIPDLKELSGIAASRVHEGIFYAHNDSGDIARFWALDVTGQPHGEFRLAAGGKAYDWEDMAVGPCDTGSCVFAGDIGDNSHVRSEYVVFVVPEPSALDPASPVTVPFTALPYRYPDGKGRNSETLMVHPATGDIYVVIKDPSPYEVFKIAAPWQPGVQVDAVLVGTVKLPISTGGSIHPCGTRLLLRGYGSVEEHRLAPGQPFDEIFGSPAVPVPFTAEASLNEAIAYEADGLGYIHVAEGAGRPIHRVACE